MLLLLLLLVVRETTLVTIAAAFLCVEESTHSGLVIVAVTTRIQCNCRSLDCGRSRSDDLIRILLDFFKLNSKKIVTIVVKIGIFVFKATHRRSSVVRATNCAIF